MVPFTTEGIWTYWFPLDASSQSKPPPTLRVVLPLHADGTIGATRKVFELGEDAISAHPNGLHTTDAPRTSTIWQLLQKNVVISKVRLFNYVGNFVEAPEVAN